MVSVVVIIGFMETRINGNQAANWILRNNCEKKKRNIWKMRNH